MHRSIWQRIEEILRKHVLHGKWTRAVIALACAVIFITTYVLIMPAVTLSRAADCGQEEHTHTEDCYETETEFTCSQEEHTHTEDCYDEEGNLICGMEEHVHDDSCYTSREVLVCGQEEHVHTEDCYAEEEAVQEDIPEEAEEAVSENEEEQSEQPQAGDTVMEQAGTAAPEQLSQIRFRDYLTDWTTLYYAPEDGDNWQPLAEDKWHPLYEDNWGIRRSDTADRGLDPEEYVLLHIGYRIPAGQINATNPEAEFILPLSINMTEEEVRDNNKYYYTLFSGTDREADELFVDGEYEIKEEWNSDGEVTQRKLVITFNEDACLRCGGEKLTDGTETLAAEELEGFFELRVKAEDLLTLEKKSESVYVLEWNDEEDLDTIIRFDPEKLTAYYGTENADDAEAETEGPVSGELRAEGKDYTITVSYTEEAGLPADVSLKVKEITRKKEYESYKAQMEEELIDPESTKVTGARFFDITLEDSEGNELHPESGVRVLIETKDTLQENEKVQICHFDEEKDKPVEVESREVTGKTYEEENLGVEFEAESFSVYGVVYTVDFEYSVNGKMYQFSLPGGGFVSFADLIEVLGIIGDTNSEENGDEIGSVITENTANEGTEEDDINSDTNTALTLGDVEVSEATRKFVADVASVEFSSPELVDVSKVENETTVGQIKEDRGLKCEYSAELTEEQIAKINAQTVEAGDWALVSVQPFTSEEILTVTMKDGEVFTIRVTDAQISTNVLTADGKNYKITVTYDDDAEIPVGTKLVAEEIEPGTDKYLQRMGQTWYEINKDYFEIEEQRKNYNESMGFLPEVSLKNLDSGRYFDIKLIHEGKEIEPSAPVHVEIDFVEGLMVEDASTVGVAHFSDDGFEIIDKVNTKTEDSSVVYFSYDQKSFSDTGTFVSHETHDLGTQYAKTLENTGSDLSLFKAGEGSTVSEEDELPKPTADKTLEPNIANGINDGTYTLTLSVSGSSKQSSYSDVTKSNVLIVMDRSSSMTSNYTYVKATGEHDSNLTYYGVVSGAISDSNRVVLSYWDNTYHYYSYGRWYVYNGDVYNRKTRMAAEQDALASLITQLTNKNLPGQSVTDEEGNTVSLDDIIEVKLISFASGRTDTGRNTASGITHTGNFTNTESNWGTSYTDGSTLKNAVTDGSVAKGTNWEEALEYAKEVADAKKAAQPDEPVYVIFLTDGEPTDIHGDNGNAQWYQDNVKCLQAAEPDAKAIVDAHNVTTADGETVLTDHKFYGIFTYGDTDTMKSYLRRLVNYAYGKGDVGTANISGGTADYYFDANSTDALLDAFQYILSQVSNNVAYGKVSITDGLTTDAMTTTLVEGSTEGYKYTVKGQLGELYTVTAKNPEEGQTDPSVTFTVNGSNYPGVKKTAAIDGRNYDYWSCTVGEGDAAVEYKMTLADVDSHGQLTWDLTGIGTLMDGYTYSASFVVWPDQDAYDYVTGLNNGLSGYMWTKSASTYEDLTSTKGYEKGGVEQFPSIVRYPNDVFAVLTNTDQKVQYSIVETRIENGETTTTYDGPHEFDLPTPNPMPLTGTSSQLEKVWNINRDPSILYKYLYESKDEDNNPVAFDIGFEIDQDGEEYKQVHLPGDYTVTADGVSYDWSAYEPDDLVEYNGKTFSKRWSQDFSIPTGLMLSEAQMDAKGLNKNKYTHYSYNGKTYYILEEGHDFQVSELSVGYEFDFEAPTYHPMLVDGVLTDVKFSTEGSTKTISGMEALEIDTGTGKSALSVFNTLRGYINVKKKVVDSDGTTELTTDDTEFTFEVELTNAMPVFEGNHIPWYGINGLYYHDVDKDDDYYQAEYVNGVLQVTTEEGGPYTGVGTAFNPDNAGAQIITYLVDGQERSVTICGNQMTPDDGSEEDGYKKVTGIARITRNETLYIANVPVNTHYTIRETGLAASGYELIDIERKVGTNASTAVPVNISAEINGEIVQNTETLVTYTNQCLVADISIQKTDPDGEGLEGAVFQLKKLGSDDHSESDASDIESVSGLSEITKNVNGETKTYTSAFESNGEVQTICGLPDGVYRLYEVVVPAGYISTYRYIQFEIKGRSMINVITDTEDTSKLDTTANNIDLKITNTPGAALPNTGGPGTRFFTIFGSILILGAGALLWRRRRRLI